MTLQLHETATKRRKSVWVGDRYLDAADTEREHERVRGRLGVDSEGVSTHIGSRDGGQVVAEVNPTTYGILGFRSRLPRSFTTQMTTPIALDRAREQSSSLYYLRALTTYHGRANMPPTAKRSKTHVKLKSLRDASPLPPAASTRLARSPVSPASPDARTGAGSLATQSIPAAHSRPTVAAAASPAHRTGTECAQRSQRRAAIADAPSPTRTRW